MIPLSQRQSSIRHIWLYVLRLQHGKYYVGITSRGDFMIRIKQHGTYTGASWTKKHKPIEILEIRDLGIMQWHKAEASEQDAFEEYSKLYGVRNVRGGRVVSTGYIFKFGRGYFNKQMLETLIVSLLLIACALVLMWKN
jgi:predicted GIY-YIG superfamily endonuclease